MALLRNGICVPGLASNKIDKISALNKYSFFTGIFSLSLGCLVSILNIRLSSTSTPNVFSPVYSPLKSITKNWDLATKFL